MSRPKHHILLLTPLYDLAPFTFPHTLTSIHETDVNAVLPQLAEATIAVTAAVRLPYEVMTQHCPRLRAVFSMGTGVDHVSAAACRERGVTLCNTPAQNVESVAEHALALFMAVKRKVVPLHVGTRDGVKWKENKTLTPEWRTGPPRTNKDETCVVVGYGALGKGVVGLMERNGMRVLIAERKGLEEVRAGRTGFDEALEVATLLVLCAPLDDGTKGMVGEMELRKMRSDAIVVNVGRGGVVDETALVKALREEWIGGAATDVFEREPATKETSPLLDDEEIPNLVLTPHIAWYSKTSIDGARRTIHSTIEGYVKGEPRNVIIQGTMD